MDMYSLDNAQASIFNTTMVNKEGNERGTEKQTYRICIIVRTCNDYIEGEKDRETIQKLNEEDKIAFVFNDCYGLYSRG